MREKIIEKSTPSTPLDSTPKVEYRNYLEMAKYGHYPLFFEEWLAETLPVETSMPTRKATHNVRHVFNLLARHNTVERKERRLFRWTRFHDKSLSEPSLESLKKIS